MKTCHHCDASFESGLTCPACHGFVPDQVPPDGLWDDALPTPSLGGWIATGDAGVPPLPPTDLGARGDAVRDTAPPIGAMGRAAVASDDSTLHAAFGAVLGPDATPAGGEPAPLDPYDERPAPADGAAAPAATGEGNHPDAAAGPGWADSSAALLEGEPAARPTGGASPPPADVPIEAAPTAAPKTTMGATNEPTGARPEPQRAAWSEPPTEITRAPVTDAALGTAPVARDALLPAAYPSWATAATDAPSDAGHAPAEQPAAARPTAQWISPPPLVGAPGEWATPAGWTSGAGAPGAYTGPPMPVDPAYAKPASFTLTPTTLAFGLGALLVIVVLAALVLRPSSPGTSSQVAGDIAGSCFTYNADHTKFDHAVPCEQSHDGEVLAFATDLTKCPEGTDAILTTATDSVGKNGVLCVRETP